LIRYGEEPSIDDFVKLHHHLEERLRPALIALRMLVALGEQEKTPTTGSVLGDFRITRKVAQGGMGIVYEALQISLGRKVAIKVLAQVENVKGNEASIIRFQNEIRASATLDHPNIVPIYSVQRFGRFHFYSMKWIEGTDWSQWRESNHGIIVASVREIALGLHHAHSRGVIHRDIKPSNLLRDDSGHVWIVDFGLAYFPTATSLTATGELVGTIRYMSPEQAQSGPKRVDERSDIYSLGATFFELLTGSAYVTADSPTEQLRSILVGKFRKPRDIDPKIPQELEIILLKMLANEPSDRYQSAHEVAEDLDRYLSNRRIIARLPTWNQLLVRWSRKHAAGLLLAVIVMATTALGLVVLVGQLNNARWQLQRQLVISHIAIAKSHVGSRKSGQRFDAMRSLALAADGLKSTGDDRELSSQLADTTATALSLCDVRVERYVDRPPAGSLDSVVFDAKLEYCTYYANGKLWVSQCQKMATPIALDLESEALTVCFSDDGNRLSILRGPEESPTVEVWDWKTAKRLWSRQSKSFSGVPQRFATDNCAGSQLMAIGLSNGCVMLLNFDNGDTKQILSTQSFPTDGAIGQVKFSNNGKWLIASCTSARRTVVWEVEGGTPVVTHNLSEDTFTFAWSSDDETLAIGSGFDISLYGGTHWQTHFATLTGPHEIIANLFFHPSGRWLAAYGYDGKTRIWDCDSLSVRLEVTGHSHRFSQTGNHLSFRTYDGVGVWEFAFDDVVWHQADRKTVALNPHGICFANNGNWIAVGGTGGCHLWEVERRRLILSLGGMDVTDVCWVESAQVLLLASPSGLFQLDLEQLEKAVTVGMREHSFPWSSVAARRIELPQQAIPVLVSAAEEGSVIACTTEDGGVVASNEPHKWKRLATSEWNYRYISVSQNGQFIAASEKNHPRTTVWQIASEKSWEIESPEGGEVAFGSDRVNVLLATSEHSRYRVWKINQLGHPPQLHFDMPRASGYQKSAVTFGKKLGWLMATDRTTVVAVDVQTGKPHATFVDGYQQNRCILFRSNNNGRFLVSANAEEGFSVWDVSKIPRY
jgi:WD40 repeat protein